jgi:hypothetical protein
MQSLLGISLAVSRVSEMIFLNELITMDTK